MQIEEVPLHGRRWLPPCHPLLDGMLMAHSTAIETELQHGCCGTCVGRCGCRGWSAEAGYHGRPSRTIMSVMTADRAPGDEPGGEREPSLLNRLSAACELKATPPCLCSASRAALASRTSHSWARIGNACNCGGALKWSNKRVLTGGGGLTLRTRKVSVRSAARSVGSSRFLFPGT